MPLPIETGRRHLLFCGQALCLTAINIALSLMILAGPMGAGLNGAIRILNEAVHSHDDLGILIFMYFSIGPLLETLPIAILYAGKYKMTLWVYPYYALVPIIAFFDHGGSLVNLSQAFLFFFFAWIYAIETEANGYLAGIWRTSFTHGCCNVWLYAYGQIFIH
jgi:hypothetical protein